MGKKLFTYGPRDVLRLLGLFFKFCMNCCVSFWSGMRSLFTKYSSVPIIEKERKYTELKTRLRLEPVLFWSWWLWRWLAFPIVPFPVVVLSLGSPWYKTPKINLISIKKWNETLLVAQETDGASSISASGAFFTFSCCHGRWGGRRS